MNKTHLLVIVLIATLVITVIPMIKAEATLAVPTVTLPNGNWSLTDSTVYPNGPAEHDPAGGGMSRYLDSSNYDVVRIYYEKAQVPSYTSQQLTDESVSIFNRDDASSTLSVDSSGTKNYAGVTAGYAKGLDSSDNVNTMELVFLKNGYYFNVFCFYDATTASQNNIDSLVNSIKVAQAPGTTAGSSLGSFFGSTTFLIIVGVVVAIIIVVVVVIVAMSKRKRNVQPQPVVPSVSQPPATQPQTQCSIASFQSTN